MFAVVLGCGDVEWFWHGGERARQASEALPAADLWYHPVAAQQQVGQGAPAGRRPHLTHRHSNEDLSRGTLCSLSIELYFK